MAQDGVRLAHSYVLVLGKQPEYGRRFSGRESRRGRSLGAKAAHAVSQATAMQTSTRFNT